MSGINFIGKCFRKNNAFIFFSEDCEDYKVRIGQIIVNDKDEVEKETKRLLSDRWKEVTVKVQIEET